MNKNCFGHFTEWAEALENYLFRDEGSDEEIFLYITPSVLNEHEDFKRLGGYDDFLRTFALSPKKRRELLQYAIQPWDNRIDGNSILDFARVLHERDGCNNLDLRHAYIAYIVLCILIVSERPENNNIGNYLTQRLSELIPNDRGDYRAHIEALWCMLHRHHPRFNNKKRGLQRYVGLLKYQLVFAPSEVSQIKDAIKKNVQLDFTEMPYDEICRRLCYYITDDCLSRKVSQSLNGSNKYGKQIKQRILQIVNSYDPTEDEDNEADDGKFTQKGEFALMLCFSEWDDSAELKLYTDIMPKQEIKNDIYTIFPSRDKIGIYNLKPVMVEKTITLKTYPDFISENHEIKHQKIGDIVYFNRLNTEGTKYVQSSKPERNKECIIFVRNTNTVRNKWERSDFKRTAKKLSVIDLSDLGTQIDFNRWEVYYAYGFDIAESNATLDQRISQDDIVMGGGIKVRNKSNTYLPLALPYFVLPQDTDPQGIKLEIKCTPKNGSAITTLRDGTDYIRKTNDDKLILDLSKHVMSGDEERLDISIAGGDTPITIYIANTSSRQSAELPRFDKWGTMINRDVSAPYVSGWKVEGSLPIELTNGKNLIQIDPLSEIDDRFYFINLLGACCYMNDDNSITRRIFRKCIKYAATRVPNVSIEEDGFEQRLRYLLINSGFITPNENYSKFQAIPPTFVKVTRSLDMANPAYALIGCYTKPLLDKLNAYCKINNVRIGTKQHPLAKKGYSFQNMLPPMILINEGHPRTGYFTPELFNKEHSELNVEYEDNSDIAYQLLNFSGCVSEFADTLEYESNFNSNSSLVNTDDNMFPRVRTTRSARSQTQYIELEKDKMYSTTTSDSAWNELFCDYKKQKPILVLNGSNTSDVYVPITRHLTNVMQRSLFLMSIGQPEYQKVFICNNPFSQNEFYSMVKHYSITGSEERKKRFFKVVTGCSEVNEQNTGIELRALPNSSNVVDRRTTMDLCIRNKVYQFTNNIPKAILIMKDKLGNSIAMAYRKKLGNTYEECVLYKADGVWKRVVDGTINEVMSKIARQPNCMDFACESISQAEVPAIDKQYDKEELIII